MLMNFILPKTEVHQLLASGNDITLCSFVLTQYRRVTDKQTDRQNCRSYKTALSIAARSRLQIGNITFPGCDAIVLLQWYYELLLYMQSDMN